jgi:predicted RNA binding protein YcfA (HicA-like mRNA interferase family)
MYYNRYRDWGNAIMTGVEMIKDLKQKGFKVIRIEGSHYFFDNGSYGVPVPHHHKELGKGLRSKILKDLKLK